MHSCEQAVILAAGRGTRLQRHDPTVQLDPETQRIAEQGIKALVPIGPKPFLDYAVDRLMAAGIRRVCLIVAPGSWPLESYVDGLPGRFAGLQAECVEQPEARGTGHALRFARPATGDRDFVMLNSDDLYPLSALQALVNAPSGASYAVGFDRDALVAHSNMEASRIPSLGILVPDSRSPDRLARVVEKPADPAALSVDGRVWVSMNLWRFSSAIYDFCDKVAESLRGEYELTSAVQDLSDAGNPVRMLRCAEPVLDLTSRADILTLRSILAP